MAIACLRFLTLCLRDFMWRISVRTELLALRLYFRPRDDLFRPELLLLGIRFPPTKVGRTGSEAGCAHIRMRSIAIFLIRVAPNAVVRFPRQRL
jgi:hypothetical protein